MDANSIWTVVVSFAGIIGVILAGSFAVSIVIHTLRKRMTPVVIDHRVFSEQERVLVHNALGSYYDNITQASMIVNPMKHQMELKEIADKAWQLKMYFQFDAKDAEK